MDLKTEQHTLSKFYSGDVKYIVPEYQRDYSWKEDEVTELWEDLYNSWMKKSDYFMGALVLCKEDKDQDIFDVVDGQQRLATFAVLCSVVKTIATNYIRNDEHELYSRIIDANEIRSAEKAQRAALNCLMDSVEEKVCLKLNKKDNPIFQDKIIESNELLYEDKDQKIVKNENRLIKARKIYFKKVINTFFTSDKVTPFEELFSFIKHVTQKAVFVIMRVDSGYDAYLLFESLNSKGLELSVTDLLKNKLLSLCPGGSDSKERVLSSWNRMIQHLEKSRFSSSVDFIRMHWCAFEENITKKSLYKKIKSKLEKDQNIVTFVNQMEASSEYFSEITDIKTFFPAQHYELTAGRWFSEINTLRYSICYPLFMYAHHVDCPFTESLAQRVLNYLFRIITIGEFAVGKADEKMNKAIELIKNDADENAVLSIFTENNFSDSEFQKAFSHKQYKDANLARYILMKMHFNDVGEETIPNKAVINLEHVLPQEPSKWNFDDSNVGLDNWIYNIGNMTLINEKENKRAYNKPFAEKVQLYRPKDETGGTSFKMTNQIFDDYEKNQIDWDSEYINKRANEFSEKAVIIWPLPDIT